MTGDATPGSLIVKGGAPAGERGQQPRAPCRQAPGRRCSAPRLAESGSSPVSTRNATGICRRRLTPSFERSVSECAFAVRDEMPSRSPTSSFEHPAAISATTSRCLGVSPTAPWIVVVIMSPRLVAPAPEHHSSEDVTRGVFTNTRVRRLRAHGRVVRLTERALETIVDALVVRAPSTEAGWAAQPLFGQPKAPPRHRLQKGTRRDGAPLELLGRGRGCGFSAALLAIPRCANRSEPTFWAA